MLFVLARVVFPMCVDPCGWSQVHIYLSIHGGWVCEPVGNGGSASLPADPEAAELQQRPLCRAAGHHSPQQMGPPLSPKQLRNAVQEY